MQNNCGKKTCKYTQMQTAGSLLPSIDQKSTLQQEISESILFRSCDLYSSFGSCSPIPLTPEPKQEKPKFWCYKVSRAPQGSTFVSNEDCRTTCDELWRAKHLFTEVGHHLTPSVERWPHSAVCLCHVTAMQFIWGIAGCLRNFPPTVFGACFCLL